MYIPNYAYKKCYKYIFTYIYIYYQIKTYEYFFCELDRWID